MGARYGWLTLTATTSRNTVDSTAILAALRDICKLFDASGCSPTTRGMPRPSPTAWSRAIPWRKSFCGRSSRKSKPSPGRSPSSGWHLAGNLHHDGNPITVWEAGHVQCKKDNNANVRPVKPARQPQKKIDGIVSTIMALDAATRLQANASIYETRGMLFV